MSEWGNRPMPDIAFKVMSFFLGLHHRFMDIGKRLEESGVRQGQTVLDFGCGPGHFTIAAAKRVGEAGKVYALDIHPLAAKSVEGKARKEGLNNITTILSDRDAGLPGESVDVVLLYDTIHLIADKRALLEELHRIVKLGGALSIWVGHMKVDDVVEIVGEGGLFTFKDRYGAVLNFEK